MRFTIKAMQANGAGGIIHTTLEAADEASAHHLAAAQGLRVLSLRRSWGGGAGLNRARREKFPILLFSQELATLLKAGLPLLDSIESLGEKESTPETRAVLLGLTRLLYEGKSFSQALASVPGVFPELFVALIQAGERTGELAEALSRYIAYRTRVDLLRQKVVGASVYPLLLLCVGGGVLLFLLGYVVPRFSLVFADMGGDLPWLSRALMAFGQWIHQNQGTVAVLAVATVVTAAVALRLPASRAFLESLLGRIPAVAQRLHVYQLSRLYRSLGILMQGGIPIVTAMGMVRGLLALEGQPLSRALEEHRLATPVALRLLRAGEQSGNLGQMLERTADFYDEETNRWVDWFMRLFEPLLMVLVGGLIGVVVILMYLPIFELASSIQ
jgi:general secretion pathway protein F